GYPASSPLPGTYSQCGRLALESVADFPWNGWPASRGIAGRLAPESAAGMEKFTLNIFVSYCMFLGLVLAALAISAIIMSKSFNNSYEIAAKLKTKP
ncbi:MAG: hypothetical protein V1806_16605, partial [Pseudomonadota bacterium]